MKIKKPRHYSYRVDHDLGFAPHVWKNLASLCGCKATTIEQWAVQGSWVVGIGGKKTGMPDKLIYAMKVTSTPTHAEFRLQRPKAAAYLRSHQIADEARVLVSEGEFYYFGDQALPLPDGLKHIIHSTQGCKRISDSDVDLLMNLVFWNRGKGKQGHPNNAQAGLCQQGGA